MNGKPLDSLTTGMVAFWCVLFISQMLSEFYIQGRLHHVPYQLAGEIAQIPLGLDFFGKLLGCKTFRFSLFPNISIFIVFRSFSASILEHLHNLLYRLCKNYLPALWQIHGQDFVFTVLNSLQRFAYLRI